MDFSDKCANAKNEVDLLKSKKVYLVSHNVFNVILTATYKFVFCSNDISLYSVSLSNSRDISIKHSLR